MGKEWEHTSWEQQHFIRMLLGISNVGYTDKVTDTDFYQTRCNRHFIKIIWIQEPMLRRSARSRVHYMLWVWEYLLWIANAAFWRSITLPRVEPGIPFHHMGNMQAVMKSFPCTSYDPFSSRKQMPYLKQMSNWEPRRTHESICNFRATTASETWCCHCLLSLCKHSTRKSLLCNGAHLWWHYTENKCVLAGVCGSGHSPLHHRLHMDHHTTLLFTVWPGDELLSVVRVWSTSAVKHKGDLC